MQFKKGDRVKSSASTCDSYEENAIPIGIYGTVIRDCVFTNSGHNVPVEWDINILEKFGHGHGIFGKQGHCWYVPANTITKVKTEE